MRTFFRLALGLLLLLAIAATASYFWLKSETSANPSDPKITAKYSGQPALKPDFVADSRAPCTEQNTLNNAYFGALHVHTALSADAYAFGVSNMPDDFYRFARGGEVELRLQSDAPGDEVASIRLDQPLDFAAVTDHAGNLGAQSLCLDPTFENRDALLCKVFRGEVTLPGYDDMSHLVRMLAFIGLGPKRSVQICGEDGEACVQRSGDIWRQIQQAAENWYDRSPACEFTTFVGYEFTLAEDGANLHRNVIFESGAVPQTPLSFKEAPRPEMMWQWLEDQCVGANVGCDAISIPHNANWSSGRMFYPYTLRDELSDKQKREYATLRADYEVLVETMQVKGDSECRNGLTSIMGGSDELCDFEKLRPPEEAFEDCGEERGAGGMRLSGCLSQYSFTRYALAAGLEEKQKLGVNPFKLGIVAATDTHSATGGAVVESDYKGATGVDRDRKHRAGGPIEVPLGIAKGSPSRYNPGGLAGVWAPENSRDALFKAMRQRETFGTSGPRIQPRFFAGWDLDPDLCDQGDMLETAYATGVPMGSDLPAKPSAQSSPSFLIQAVADPAAHATPLQRLQVIKVWSDENGQTHQQIYDVAGDPDNGASVDEASCKRSGTGFAKLCSVWKDPQFNADLAAVYYARAVENPSCRWLGWDCARAPEGQKPVACADPLARKSVQERAWTSPVWYEPGA